jgi:ammonia channel protein AmtB
LATIGENGVLDFSGGAVIHLTGGVQGFLVVFYRTAAIALTPHRF